MTPEPVLDGFNSIEHMLSEFEEPALPPDTHVLLAIYDNADYQGEAFVLVEKDGKLFEVNASYCSCNGLEGQWTLEDDVTPEALLMRDWAFPNDESVRPMVVKVLNEWSKRHGKDAVYR